MLEESICVTTDDEKGVVIVWRLGQRHRMELKRKEALQLAQILKDQSQSL